MSGSRLATFIDLPAVLLVATVVFLIAAAVAIYRETRRAGGPAWTVVWHEYRAVMLCFAVLTVAVLVLGVASYLATPANGDFRASVLQGWTGSLLEDLVFFSLLGFIIILVQRREADRQRNLDDKIDLLFNAKALRSGEIAYLRDLVRGISADCRQTIIEVNVIGYDATNGLVQLDITRRWYVANYLSSESAEYRFQIDITPDDACGNTPLMHIFPAITNTVQKDASGEWERVASDEILDAGVTLTTAAQYRPEQKMLTILPGQIREFQTRYQSWQRIYKPLPPGAATGVPREPDAYEVLLMKHWDEILIHVRNSLQRTLRVTISGRDSKSFELLSGNQQLKAYRVENLSINSRIFIALQPG